MFLECEGELRSGYALTPSPSFAPVCRGVDQIHEAPERPLQGALRPSPLGGHSSIAPTQHFPGPNHPICQDLTSSRFPHWVIPCCFFLALSIR